MTSARCLPLVAVLLVLAVLTATPAQAAFTDNNDGTITDTVTSLMWDKCAYGQSANDCSGGSAARRTWQQALTDVVALNGISYKGHNDWRLPNIKELESLVKIDASLPAIDGTAFPNTDETSWYWSSTFITPATPFFDGEIYGVSFIDGTVGTIDSTLTADKSFVRLVRSGQPGSTFDLLAPPSAIANATKRAAADAPAVPVTAPAGDTVATADRPATPVLQGATVAGNTITLTLTGGQQGDDNSTVNGNLGAPSGPRIAADPAPMPTTPIPVLDEWPMRLLLVVLVLLIAVAMRRVDKLPGVARPNGRDTRGKIDDALTPFEKLIRRESRAEPDDSLCFTAG